jgi:hypothetical protein
MRTLTILPLLALALAACADKAPEATTDDTTTVAAVVPEVQTPHVMGFEAGRALDSLGSILGGVSARYTSSDTIFVSVRAQYVTPGAKIEAVLLKGTTKAASDQGVVGEADPKNGVAIVPIRFARATPWAKGSYQIEIFLDGISQGLKPIDIE